MSAFENLRNAPIREALIDIQVQLSSVSPDPNEVKRHFADLVRDSYPKVEERRSITAILAKKPDADTMSVSSQHEIEGFLFKAADGCSVFQVRINGFTHNRLKPYDSFDAFKSDARTLWGYYSEFMRPAEITRVGLRYINELEAPAAVANLSDIKKTFTFDATLPNVPVRRLDGYSFTMNTENDEGSLKGNIAIALERKAPGRDAFILDIDVYSVKPPTEADVWTTLDTLRSWKNEIFFNIVQPSVIKRYR